jgi:gliding motility-associated-like protein
MGCITVLTKNQYITVNPKPTALFTNSNANSCSPPASIQFTNQSSGTGLTYQWTFGDGGTSTATDPSHTYITSGNFTVRLITINASGCRDTITKTNLVQVGSIHATFTSADSVCVNKTISFTCTSNPAPTSVTWDFGDATTSSTLNPVKFYSAPGTYTVKLKATFGSCVDSVTKTVVVKPKPTLSFTGNPVVSCQAPLTVNFTNQSGGGFTYLWDFGDGGTSTQANPSHTYNSNGSYSVTLYVTNSLGCQDTFKRANYVIIRPPQVAINNLPLSGCAPLSTTFITSVNSVEPIITWLWDFGDGTFSNQASPTHTFPIGSYNIKLTITTSGGCTVVANYTPGVIVSTKPSANFSANPRDVCAHLPIDFTDLSTGTVTGWQWNFGDGGTSTSQNPTHIYEDTGYFNVRLIISNNGCNDTIIFTNYVHIKPPVANFNASFQCSDPKTQVFHDLSIGADEWNWNFGDGNTTTQQNPTHQYADTGTYDVTLWVRNFTTGCDYTRHNTVHVVIEKAKFLATDSVICRNTPITFNSYGNTLTNVASFRWEFGDGTADAGPVATHVYTQAGTYTVSLVVTDVVGCKDTLVKNMYIQVDGPTSNFSINNPGTCLMNTVAFTDSSLSDGTHPISSWRWDYGDGVIETLTAPPFQHNYTSPGTYTVSLTVTDSKGCTDTLKMTDAISISKPVAIFTTTDTASCPGKDVHFTNSSSGPSLNSTWDFGDGSTSASTNPTHVYTTDGVYTVRLYVTDQFGCKDTLVKPAYITIGTPHANFSLSDSVATCPPLFVNFSNASANYTTLHWDFGDGTSTNTNDPSHFYSTPGTYHPKLIITSPGGCVDSIENEIIVRGPIGSFSYGPISGCRSLATNFTASTLDRLSFIWDFNDGTVTSNMDSVISHVYTLPGRYVPKMILVDPNGCQVPINGPDTILVKGVDAAFNFNTQAICDSGSVAFANASVGNDPITNYEWNFGDGGTASTANPSHSYIATGIYFPQLIVTTQAGCKDTSDAIAPVRIVASPKATINNSGNGCVPLTATFSGALTVADTSAITWTWTMGNGNISNAQSPPAQQYNTAAVYNIHMVATNSTGCKDLVDTTVEAYLIPPIDAGIDTLVCRGNGVTLTANGADSYTWSPSNGLSCNNCPTPTASPDSLTSYIVQGKTIHGCINVDTVNVQVRQRFVMTARPGDTLCKGGSVRMFASGASTYSWSPGTSLNSTTSAAPMASPNTTTTYRVIGEDDRKCFKDTSFVTIKVYPIPTVEAGQDKTINVGQSIDLIPAVSPDVTNVIWTPSTGLVSNIYPGIKVQPKTTTDYLIEVRNPGGCKSKDKVTVFVVCNGANVFIPNTFSPNGDRMNDVFYPRGTGLFQIKTFRVFNRWGEIVYEKSGFLPNDESAGWNGSFNGKKLAPDVYVYTIEILCDNNIPLVFKGNVALIQ